MTTIPTPRDEATVTAMPWFARLPLGTPRVAEHTDARTVIAFGDEYHAVHIEVVSSAWARQLVAVMTGVTVAREAVEARAEIGGPR